MAAAVVMAAAVAVANSTYVCCGGGGGGDGGGGDGELCMLCCSAFSPRKFLEAKRSLGMRSRKNCDTASPASPCPGGKEVREEGSYE
jgi:hypothetical protein